MKFKIFFKTPDTMQDSINRAVDELGIADEEQKHHTTMQLVELAEDYIQYGENVTLEFDTDNASVQVRQCRKCLKQGDYTVKEWVKNNPGWHYIVTLPAIAPNGSLIKEFTFPDFNSAMAFATRIAMWSERHDHHPDLKISWGKVEVTWNTYDAGGVTVHDFAGATATDSFYTSKK